VKPQDEAEKRIAAKKQRELAAKKHKSHKRKPRQKKVILFCLSIFVTFVLFCG
jgi:hypothetical protein